MKKDDQIASARCFSTFEKKTEQSNSESWLAPMFRSEFTSSRHWSFRRWLNYLQKGGGPKKRFQYCVDPYAADTILHLRAVRGHSGGKHINPDFAEHIYHVGSSHEMHSIIESGLIPGGQDVKNGRHVGVLYSREPNVHRSFPRKGLRRDEAQDCSAQKQLENKSNTIFSCNLRVAQRKRIADLSNAIKRDHPLQHFTCSVYREGGAQEVRRRSVQ